MGFEIRRSGRAWRVLLAMTCLLGLLLLPGIAYAQDDTIEEEPGPYPDYGDAPTRFNNSATPMTAYPAGGPPGVVANFPVCLFASPASPDGYGMCHEGRSASYLGPAPLPSKSGEWDADTLPDDDFITNIDPSTDTADQDGHDDGVTFPAVLPQCSPVTIFVEGFIPADDGQAVTYYIEGWFDWKRDGDWNDGSFCGCGDDEWAIQDWPVTPDPETGRFTASIPIVPCHPVSDTDPLWVRVTLSPHQFVGLGRPWSAGGTPGGRRCLSDGETEDYYLTPEARREEFVPEPGSILLLGSGLAGLAGYATLRWRTRE